MTEYIEREAVRNELYDADAITMKGVAILNKFPAADVAPVVHARWVKLGEADYQCSSCGFRFTSGDDISEFKHCRCGAKMDGERRKNDSDN